MLLPLVLKPSYITPKVPVHRQPFLNHLKPLSMKNLLLSAVLILLSFAGYSTSRGIEIINRSQCDVYIQLHGSEKCPSCEHQFTSNLFVIPAVSVVTLPNTSMLGGTFPPNAFVNCATIYSGPRHCQRLERWMVGDPRCDNCPPEITFYSMNQDCKVVCDCLRARWEPSECDGIARLIIEPC